MVAGISARTAALALILGGVVVLNGCAMQRGDQPVTDKTAAQLIAEADTKASAGEDDAAVVLLRQATLKNPVDATPWLKIAKIRFDSNDYVDALVASEEVISRDQSSEAGNSIALVSSLRLAERSLGVLRSGTDLDGSMRDRAQQLAGQLRETLGEDALLPASASKRRPARTARRTTRSSSPAAKSSSTKTSAPASAPSSTPPPASSNKSDDGSMNPFDTLQKLPE